MKLTKTSLSLFIAFVALLTSTSATKAATLVSFPSQPVPSNLNIPRGTLNPFTGGGGWGFRSGQTFSFITQWANFSSQNERVTFNFSLVEDDPFFDDAFSQTVSFLLPAMSALNIPLSTTLSANQLNSTCEPNCTTRFGIGYASEQGRLEFKLESPTFTATPVASVPEPSSNLGILALCLLGTSSLLKHRPKLPNSLFILKK